MRLAPIFPVTFVASDGKDASDGIVMVREFLWRELAAHPVPENPITLAMLGPSPMHVDCSVERTDSVPSSPGSVVAVRTLHRGYPTVQFGYHPDAFHSTESAYEAVKDSIAREVGLFYSAVASDGFLRRRNVVMDVLLSSFVELHDSSGPISFLKRLFTSGRRGRELALAQLRTSTLTRQMEARLEEEAAKHYEIDTNQVFRPEVDAMVSEVGQDRGGSEVSMAIETLESRHGRDLEIAALSISPLAGGFVGAAMTVWLQR